MNNSVEVANYIIDLKSKESKFYTPLKLMKLVYILHGYSLVILQELLISDDVEAWKYGPAIPDIYEACNDKKNLVTKPIGNKNVALVDGYTQDLISSVLGIYADFFTDKQLCTFCHRPGSAWYITWNDNKAEDIIEPSLIYDEFYKRVF